MPFIPLPLRPPRKRKQRSRKTITAAPPAPPPPPPVEYVNVSVVFPAAGYERQAVWVFSQDVEDPTTTDAPGLLIEGNPGIAWVRTESNALRVQYDEGIAVADGWTCDAGAAGIVGVSGDPLAAGSGEVTTPA